MTLWPGRSRDPFASKNGFRPVNQHGASQCYDSTPHNAIHEILLRAETGLFPGSARGHQSAIRSIAASGGQANR